MNRYPKISRFQDVPVKASPEQEQLRKEIAFQTACYLAKGGEIKSVPVEASGVK